jgi:DNA replication and repair protein RecF
MRLERLCVENVRCISAADLAFDARRNLIYGPNASGKTSLLEAIYFIGRGRSFRAARNETLIAAGEERLAVTGFLSDPRRRSVLGLRFGNAGLQARLDGEPVAGVAQLATTFPVQAIEPELHQLIEEGPEHRRRFLDWGVFHVEPSYVGTWQRYQRALRQRNAALRTRAAQGVVRAWDGELIDAGARIVDARQRYLTALRPGVRAMGERLLGQPVELHLSQGWAVDRSLSEALDRSWSRDVERGVTHVGPHRADLQIRVNGEPARQRVSRGQQKLVSAAMLLGQLRCDAEQGSPTAALLVDDPAAELDGASLDKLLSEIRELPLQLFITVLEGAPRSAEGFGAGARFHVEHGKFTRLV